MKRVLACPCSRHSNTACIPPKPATPPYRTVRGMPLALEYAARRTQTGMGSTRGDGRLLRAEGRTAGSESRCAPWSQTGACPGRPGCGAAPEESDGRLLPSAQGGREPRLSAFSGQRALRFADLSAMGQRRQTQRQWQTSAALKVGDVKIIFHRPLEGTPKTATIRRTATGKWFVTISCEWEPTPLPPTGQAGRHRCGAEDLRDPARRTAIANPRFFRREERALAQSATQHQLALDAHKATRAA